MRWLLQERTQDGFDSVSMTRTLSLVGSIVLVVGVTATLSFVLVGAMLTPFAQPAVAGSKPAVVPTDSLQMIWRRDRYRSIVTRLANCQDADCRWPAEAAPPADGALLPFHRIVAFYGNFYSAHMGILGKYPPSVVLEKLREQVALWQQAAPNIPVVPAIDYIAITAQDHPTADGDYNLNMADGQIKKAIMMAKTIGGITILEVQPGWASLLSEVKTLEEFLKKPRVHLAIDPEYSMIYGNVPGQAIGSVTAEMVNNVARYLAKLVEQYNLPPKILVVHAFTEEMILNEAKIETRPNVQIVIDMDGWGPKYLKRHSYRVAVADVPVQFTGFKVFFQQDRLPPSEGIMSPEEILSLTPRPIFIQYQ